MKFVASEIGVDVDNLVLCHAKQVHPSSTSLVVYVGQGQSNIFLCRHAEWSSSRVRHEEHVDSRGGSERGEFQITSRWHAVSEIQPKVYIQVCSTL